MPTTITCRTAVWGLVLLAGILPGLRLLTGPDYDALIFRENGVIETLSAIGYIAFLPIFMALGGKKLFFRHWYYSVIFLSFFARELDFHKKFTGKIIFDIKFFLDQDVQPSTKFISFFIIVIIFLSIAMVLKNHFLEFIKRILSNKTHCPDVSVVMALSFQFISKIICDGAQWKLAYFGIEISSQTRLIFQTYEETLELSAPYLFIVALIYYFRIQLRDPPKPLR